MSSIAQIPTSFGHELRACLRCRLVKTYDQFRESGCENCPFFKMEDDHELVGDCTTSNFTGIISVMDPTRSWAARWLRIGKFVPGCYTLAVSEMLSEELQHPTQGLRLPSTLSWLPVKKTASSTFHLNAFNCLERDRNKPYDSVASFFAFCKDINVHESCIST